MKRLSLARDDVERPARMDQPHRARQLDLVGLDDDHLALDAAQVRAACRARRGRGSRSRCRRVSCGVARRCRIRCCRRPARCARAASAARGAARHGLRRERTARRESGRQATGSSSAQRVARRAVGGRWSVCAKRSKSARSRACATTSEPLNGVSRNMFAPQRRASGGRAG